MSQNVPVQPFVRTACPDASMGMCMCVWACCCVDCLFVCVTLWCSDSGVQYSTVLYSYCVSNFRGVYVLVFVGCGYKKERVVCCPSGVQ
jgi:hypothetical protein